MIRLNEDLFKDEVEFEEESVDEVSAEETQEQANLSGLLIQAINDEWDTINFYNQLIAELNRNGHEDMIAVIEDINNEEHKHVGQLQECLRTISSDIPAIAEGEQEGKEQLDGDEDSKENQ